MSISLVATGFHRGELAVQRRAGVRDEAARLAGMLAPARLDGGPARFLAQREFAVLTTRDAAGTLWTSPLLGPAGFLDGHGGTLDVHTVPAPSDPLAGLRPGGPAGLLAAEFAIRRRFRVNGTISAAGPRGFTVDVQQAYGNCPSYLQQRVLDPVATAPAARAAVEHRELGPEQWAVIGAADTFFLGTEHPERGADASVKGGRPGFVRPDGDGLWWPDYPGNNLFNSLGNLVVNPEAALLFIDFTTGATLHLTGRATLEWLPAGTPGDDGGTGRRVHFRPGRILTAAPLPVHAHGVTPSPHNPPLSR